MEMKRIPHMIEREKNAIEALSLKDLSKHGHWDKGYHEGRLSVLEDILIPTESAIDVDAMVGQLKALADIEERDMNYYSEHSYKDECIYNSHDAAEMRYKAFCEAIEIITSTVNKQEENRVQKFDMILLEKSGNTGLTADEIMSMMQLVARDSVYPVEFPASQVESTTMGFITEHMATDFDFSYDEIIERVSDIMNDMENESDDGVYVMKGKNFEHRILLTRNILK